MTPLRILAPLLIETFFLWMSVVSAGEIFYDIDEGVGPGTVIGNVADDLAITIDANTEFSMLGVPNETAYVSLDSQTGKLLFHCVIMSNSFCLFVFHMIYFFLVYHIQLPITFIDRISFLFLCIQIYVQFLNVYL